MLGSTTERVLRTAPCPVLTVPRRAPDLAADAGVRFPHILCPVDFSPSSMKALDYAASLAQEADAHLHVLHVAELVPSFEPVVMGGPGAPPVNQNALAGARQRLHDAISDEVRTFCSVHEVVAAGKPYKEILRHAEENRVELIVMGAHGGALGLAAFGSTTNQIVRHAACPVLTLKA
jgi:nucleotide-binding universal stress UspA family protein